MNLDNIKGSKKAELEITPSREFLTKQADNSTQNCRATKGIFNFLHCATKVFGDLGMILYGAESPLWQNTLHPRWCWKGLLQ